MKKRKQNLTENLKTVGKDIIKLY